MKCELERFYKDYEIKGDGCDAKATTTLLCKDTNKRYSLCGTCRGEIVINFSEEEVSGENN